MTRTRSRASRIAARPRKRGFVLDALGAPRPLESGAAPGEGRPLPKGGAAPLQPPGGFLGKPQGTADQLDVTSASKTGKYTSTASSAPFAGRLRRVLTRTR